MSFGTILVLCGRLFEVIDVDVRETEYIDKAADSMKSVTEEMELEPQIEVIPDVSDVPVVDNFTSIESTNLNVNEYSSIGDDFDLKADARVEMPETYAEYSLLSVEEKVELFSISDYADSLDVMRLVKRYF
jgi:hypothetical protein